MAYTKQTWTNNSSIANAERLNHIEDGIYNNAFESGSNDNGNYIKFNDGTLICYGQKEVGTVPAGSGTNVDITLPYQFVDYNYMPQLTHGANVGNWAMVGLVATGRTTTKFTISTWNNASSVSGSITAYWIAIGKWE